MLKTSAGASAWKVRRETVWTWTPANRASTNPTPAIAKTGRRSDTKIERRSCAALVTSARNHMRSLVYFRTRSDPLRPVP